MKNTYNLNIVISGSGKPIVFLHGWGGNHKNFLYFQQRLCKKYKVINFDLPGFGESGIPIEGMGIYEYAEIVYLFLRENNLKNITLVGHSFGGRIAIILASMFDLDVQKLVLIDAAGLKPRYNLLTQLRILNYKTVKGLVHAKILPASVLDKYGSEDYRELNPQMKKIFVKVVNQHLDYLLPDIACETLIVWGKKDKSTPYHMAKKLQKGIKNAGLVVYKDAGHFSYIEHKENFLSVLQSFLES